ncbi:hypothetical protein RF11_06982 [Thelohanellus kitauei]|uniref:Uncharacterized protein n=1 Tax=Thelohanellus kitauei TaxID=669202 RepID=A0A0C2N9R7_THEKT|nr:hypothetical protein RF11_06982 [Thelohanellus kitauei]
MFFGIILTYLGFFRFLQVMYGPAWLALAASPILAMLGFFERHLQKLFARVILGLTGIFGFFTLLYTIQFLMLYSQRDFIFTDDTLERTHGFEFDSRLLQFPGALILVWFMTIALFCLGALVSIHNYGEEIHLKFLGF